MPIDMSWDALPPEFSQRNHRHSRLQFRLGCFLIIIYYIPHNGAEYFVREWLTVDAPETQPPSTTPPKAKAG